MIKVASKRPTIIPASELMSDGTVTNSNSRAAKTLQTLTELAALTLTLGLLWAIFGMTVT